MIQVSKNSHEYWLLYCSHKHAYFLYQTCMFTTHMKYLFDNCELYFMKMSDE
jgi:hypothetical protein